LFELEKFIWQEGVPVSAEIIGKKDEQPVEQTNRSNKEEKYQLKNTTIEQCKFKTQHLKCLVYVKQFFKVFFFVLFCFSGMRN